MLKKQFIILLAFVILTPFSLFSQKKSDSIKEVKSFEAFSYRKLILPVSLIGVGVLGSVVDGMNDFHLFSRNDKVDRFRLDDYAEWGVFSWVFFCDLLGKEKHHWKDQLAITFLSEGINAVGVKTTKHFIHKERPCGTPYSFPSGHTSNAFVAAHIAYKEFKDSNLWLAYSGYCLGVMMATSRLYNNRHWVTDVVAGAGYGILSVELAYAVYPCLKKTINRFLPKSQASRLTLLPQYMPEGAGGFYLCYEF